VVPLALHHRRSVESLAPPLPPILDDESFPDAFDDEFLALAPTEVGDVVSWKDRGTRRRLAPVEKQKSRISGALET